MKRYLQLWNVKTSTVADFDISKIDVKEYVRPHKVLCRCTFWNPFIVVFILENVS